MILAKYHLGDQIKKNEIGVEYSTCWGEKRCVQGSGRKR